MRTRQVWWRSMGLWLVLALAGAGAFLAPGALADRNDEAEDDGDRFNLENGIKEWLEDLPARRRPEVMKFAEEHFGRHMQELRELARREPDEAWDAMEDILNEAIMLLKLRENEPAEFKRAMAEMAVERKAEGLAEKLEQTKIPAEREKLTAELKQLLGRLFAAKQARMKREITELEDELNRLKTLVNKREENRDAVIGRHIREMSGEMDYLEW